MTTVLAFNAYGCRFAALMEKGIQVGNRRYKFLAYSASQLKNGSYWSMALLPRSKLLQPHAQSSSNDALYLDVDQVWQQLIESIKKGSKGKFAAR